MTAGENDLIRRQEAGPFPVQIFIGGDVVGEREAVEPLDQVEIGREVSWRGGEILGCLGAHGDDRAQARGVADAAAIEVFVVDGAAEVRPRDEEVIGRGEALRFRRVGAGRCRAGHVHPEVGVGEVGVGRRQVEDRR